MLLQEPTGEDRSCSFTDLLETHLTGRVGAATVLSQISVPTMSVATPMPTMMAVPVLTAVVTRCW